MQMSRRGRYALTALLDLVFCQRKNQLATAGEIAHRQKIPLPFLEQLLAAMKRHKLVTSKRGPKGGYFLSRPSSEINVFQVFTAVENKITIVECLQSKDHCSKERSCLTRPLWEKMNQSLFQILKETSLEDLCQSKKSI